MKKVFLSLAALAFVATGTVSCSSDDGGSNNGGGTNDDTPGTGDDTPGTGDDTPGTESNVFNWGGNQYDIDTTLMGFIGTADGPTVYNVDTDGDGEGDTQMTSWIVATFGGTDYQSSSDLVQTEILVPVGVDGENLTLIYPHESETVYLQNAFVFVGGEVVAPAETDEISAFDIQFNVVDAEGETIDYTTSTTFTSGEVSLEFNGTLDAYYYFTQDTAASSFGKASNVEFGGKGMVKRSLDKSNVVEFSIQ